MAGKRTSLASLAGEKVEDVPGRSTPTLVRLKLESIVPTPLNPRTNFGTPEDLAELAGSMRRRQLQPVVVVSRVLYLKLFPEHTDEVGSATYVIANGERRFRAATHGGLGVIEAVIRDEVAASRREFLDAVLSENIDRKNFDPIEEAEAVEAMVLEFGSARNVAEHRGKHEAWVSQRRSLLRLGPALRELVSSRQMPVEKARKLAKATKDYGLDEAGQLAWWALEQDRPRPAPRASAPSVAPEAPPVHDEAAAAPAAQPAPVPSIPSARPQESVPVVRDIPEAPSAPARSTESTGNGSTNLTAVKSPPAPVVDDPKERHEPQNLTAVKSDTDTLGLPWHSPTALDRLLRRHMTAEHRSQLIDLLSVDA
ncbi:ParB/RepB/Spo0J family partition protein [Embleya hyalina]|uniref:Plasmid partitioning protein n=1 Tax=Embleya hyalina TaxID=516124 RepID=A0A401YQN3_9ACTN|nr:ParB/RepB/Spo0J family partition protein [Embleya hyalina]GCD96929.1 plasmid partitioning protein [Embleya hyalina]